ncbi:MAG: hypothetical protein FJW40_20105 [Acidobacteria bacterium]|nr:hypothetical protein [Acidobacteriota bacterium]
MKFSGDLLGVRDPLGLAPGLGRMTNHGFRPMANQGLRPMGSKAAEFEMDAAGRAFSGSRTLQVEIKA